MGFIIDIDSLAKSEVEITHINLNDGTLEGIRHQSPAGLFRFNIIRRHRPGPHDSRYLFEQFMEDMKQFDA